MKTVRPEHPQCSGNSQVLRTPSSGLSVSQCLFVVQLGKREPCRQPGRMFIRRDFLERRLTEGFRRLGRSLANRPGKRSLGHHDKLVLTGQSTKTGLSVRQSSFLVTGTKRKSVSSEFVLGAIHFKKIKVYPRSSNFFRLFLWLFTNERSPTKWVYLCNWQYQMVHCFYLTYKTLQTIQEIPKKRNFFLWQCTCYSTQVPIEIRRSTKPRCNVTKSNRKSICQTTYRSRIQKINCVQFWRFSGRFVVLQKLTRSYMRQSAKNHLQVHLCV